MSYVAGSGIGKWWASIKRLPNWGGGLRSLMTPTIGVLAGSMPVVPNVYWCPTTDTAYADRSKKLIVIGERLFAEHAPRRINPDATKEHAIETCLGLIVHEGMHFKFSPETVKELLNPGVPFNKVTGMIANVVEDIFIEYQAPLVDNSYGWMISSLWEYYWPTASMQENIDNAWDGSSRNIEAILNTMVMWKNQNFDFNSRSEFEQQLFELVYSVRGMNVLQDRKDLIEKIIRVIFTEEEFEQQENEGEGEGDGDGVDYSKPFDTLGKPVFVPGVSSGMTRIVSNETIIYSDAGAASGAPYVFKNVEESYRKFEVDNYGKWVALAKWQLDVGSVRTHRGTPGNYGRLTHPARLNDDGKIFSKVQRSAPSGRVAEGGAPQTILLIDFSGSMNGRVYGSRQSKFNAAMHVAGGVGKSLTQAKHRVAVYGHTTNDVGSAERCEIYTIKGFTESADVLLKRIQTLDYVGALHNNMDATAIEAVSRKFKFDGSPCRLFVISDGQPACYLYSGSVGIDVTREQVNKLRKQGIEVYSMCIDPSAMEVCNRIYGAPNNFDVTDPKVADKVIKKVLGGN